METILLDTNVLSELMHSQPDQAVFDWFAERTGDVFYISAITQAEILLGISLLPAGKRRDALAAAADGMFSQDFAGRCLSFDARSAAAYAAVVSGRRPDCRHRPGARLSSGHAQCQRLFADQRPCTVQSLANMICRLDHVKAGA